MKELEPLVKRSFENWHYKLVVCRAPPPTKCPECRLYLQKVRRDGGRIPQLRGPREWASHRQSVLLAKFEIVRWI